MQIRNLEELAKIDERCQRFTPLGLGITRMLTPEAAAEHHQRTIMVELSPNVAESTRNSFEQLQRTHIMGILDYELFTVAEGYSLMVLEQAFAERFVAYYSGQVPLTNTQGDVYILEATGFDAVYDALNRGGARRWKVKSLAKPTVSLPFRANFASLLDWARHEGLLHGQRFRRQEPLLRQVRNAAAHPTSYRLRTPLDSAASIRQVGEIINRIWGGTIAGGRVFPDSLERRLLFIGWSAPTKEMGVLTPETLLRDDAPKDWRYLAVLATEQDENLWHFDADVEATDLPAELVWGSGNWQEAADWLAKAARPTDRVDYLDRLFVIGLRDEHVDAPRNVNQFAGLPPELRGGRWLLLKADWPTDAYAHGRAVASGASGHASAAYCEQCCVETLATADWQSVLAAAESLKVGIVPKLPSGVRVEGDRLRWA